jgi:hypothetical protein
VGGIASALVVESNVGLVYMYEYRDSELFL